jgi:hypothetical protein
MSNAFVLEGFISASSKRKVLFFDREKRLIGTIVRGKSYFLGAMRPQGNLFRYEI